MSYSEVRELAMALSETDRDRLAEELTVSVSNTSHPFAAEWAETVNRRIDEVESGEATTRPFREVIDELRATRVAPTV